MKTTLNIGCGNRIYKEYPAGYECINFDFRSGLEGVDVVGNAEDLSMFENNSFSYILASDIIEHFPIAKTTGLLKEWARVLKPGGIIEIRTPNLIWVLKHYSEHRDTKFVSYHIFGGQDYEGNFHYVIFDGNWLSDLCSNVGLSPSEYEEEGSNFILKAIKI